MNGAPAPTHRPLPVVAGRIPKHTKCTYYKNGPSKTSARPRPSNLHPLEGILEYDNGVERVIYDGRGCLVGEPVPTLCGHILFMTHDLSTSKTRLLILSNGKERAQYRVYDEVPNAHPIGNAWVHRR